MANKFNTDHHYNYSLSTITRLLARHGLEVARDFQLDYHLFSTNERCREKAARVVFRGVVARKVAPTTDSLEDRDFWMWSP